MMYDPQIHHRRSIRVRGFDYASRNAYFVTICVAKRRCIFGTIRDSKPVLSLYGKIVSACWDDLPNHYPHIELDEFVVMPNHVHGILRIVGAGFKPAPTENLLMPCANARAGLKPAPTEHGLAEVVRAFKTFSARRINALRKTQGVALWQRNYYEHIVRHVEDLKHVRDYIIANPGNWESDEMYETTDGLK